MTGFRERRVEEIAFGDVMEVERRSSNAEPDGRGGSAGRECGSSPSLWDVSVWGLDLCGSDIVG